MGNVDGMSNLGQLLYLDEAADPKEAVEWLRRAVDAGCPNALSTLAFAYAIGRGVEKDLAAARRWAAAGAAAGNEEAAELLAKLNAVGERQGL